MFEIRGKVNTAVCYASVVEQEAIDQIRRMCDYEFTLGSRIRIMPDVHAGAGCTIGTTMTISDKVIPNLVGVDIGCGMLATKLKEERINLPKFDSVSQAEIPAGMKMRKTPHTLADELSAKDLACFGKSACRVSEDVFRLSLGTLGGGNHFWELDKDEEGSIWLVVHTGSRRSGKDVAEYYQRQAYEHLNLTGAKYRELLAQKRKAFIEELTAQGRKKEISKLLPKWEAEQSKPEIAVSYEVAWCEGQLFDDYIHDMKIMQEYARLNRRAFLPDDPAKRVSFGEGRREAADPDQYEGWRADLCRQRKPGLERVRAARGGPPDVEKRGQEQYLHERV